MLFPHRGVMLHSQLNATLFISQHNWKFFHRFESQLYTTLLTLRGLHVYDMGDLQQWRHFMKALILYFPQTCRWQMWYFQTQYLPQYCKTSVKLQVCLSINNTSLALELYTVFTDVCNRNRYNSIAHKMWRITTDRISAQNFRLFCRHIDHHNHTQGQHYMISTEI